MEQIKINEIFYSIQGSQAGPDSPLFLSAPLDAICAALIAIPNTRTKKVT